MSTSFGQRENPFEVDFDLVSLEEAIETISKESNVYAVTFPREAFGFPAVNLSDKSVDIGDKVRDADEEYSPYGGRKETYRYSNVDEGEGALVRLKDRMENHQYQKFLENLWKVAQEREVRERYRSIDIDTLSDLPAFKLPQSINSPTDICPVLGPVLYDKLFIPNADSFTVILCDACPANLLIHYKTQDGHDVIASIYFSIFDHVEENGKIYRKYAYNIKPETSEYGSETYLSIVETPGRKVVNNVRRGEGKKTEAYDGYEFIEDETELPLAQEEMRKKRSNYSKEALVFGGWMRKADDFMKEFIRHSDISDLREVSRSVKRYSIKNGRGETLEELAHLRSLLSPWLPVFDQEHVMPHWLKHIPEESDLLSYLVMSLGEKEDGRVLKFLEELNTDLHLGEGYITRRKKNIKIVSSLLAIFNIERGYLAAVKEYPWNSVSSEPFETLQEIIWFRDPFGYVINSRHKEESALKEYRKELGKGMGNAAGRKNYEEHLPVRGRIVQLAFPGFGFKERSEPLVSYLSLEDIHRIKERKRILEKLLKRPSILTLKLWRALKWAQPSPWRMRSTSIERHGLLSDEVTINPLDREITDLQMRITLAGEDLEEVNGMSHLISDSSDEASEVVLSRIYRAAERSGIDITVEKASEIRDRIMMEPAPLAESEKLDLITQKLQHVLKTFSLRELFKEIKKMPFTAQFIMYHRLGYNHPEFIDINHHQIKYIIDSYFDNNSYEYYKAVQLIARLLSEKGNKRYHLAQLRKFTKERDEKILAEGRSLRNADQPPEEAESLLENQDSVISEVVPSSDVEAAPEDTNTWFGKFPDERPF